MFSEIVGAEGKPDLVLLHGGIGTGLSHWQKVARRLAGDYRIHLPDLPGHGKTLLPDDGRYDRELLVAAVRSYLEPLAPVHVGAFSMGGHTALALINDGGADLFASVTLIGVSIREHDGLRGWREYFDPDTLQRDYPLWAKFLARVHAPQGGPEAWRDVCRRDSKGLRIDVDLDRLKDLQAPVLLVRGDHDMSVDASHYATLREVWPHAEEFVVPDGGHDVQLTRARIFEAVYADFLKRVQKEHDPG